MDAKKTKPILPGERFVNDEGFGLTVKEEYGRTPNRQWRTYVCTCDCGNEKIVAANALRYGMTKSCGCLKTTMVTVRGEYIPLKEAISRYATVKPSTVRSNLSEGMPIEQALVTQPPKKKQVRRPKKGKIFINGEWLTLATAVRKYGAVSRQTVYQRLESGEYTDPVAAITTPGKAGPSKGSVVPIKRRLPIDLKEKIKIAAKGVNESTLVAAYGLKEAEIRQVLAEA